MKTHTLGPWQWRTLHDGRVRQLVTRAPALEYNDPVILTVREDWTGATDPDMSANARLIAAAPALVDALRSITECAAAGPDGANMDLWIDQARTLLARIDGEATS